MTGILFTEDFIPDRETAEPIHYGYDELSPEEFEEVLQQEAEIRGNPNWSLMPDEELGLD